MAEMAENKPEMVRKIREMEVGAVISKIEGNNNQTNSNKEGGHLIKILPLRVIY